MLIIIQIALDFIWKILYLLWPYIGTIFLGWVAWKIWVHYIQQDFISGIEFVMLEIIPPREVERSPKAMELFFTNALYHWSNKGGLEEYWQGAVWFWFSLEIVSIEGQVHFYIRTPSRLKELIETQMYAQYPQSQIRVVEDYTLAVDEITEESAWRLWGCEFKLEKEEAYPIKTYVDYGLSDDPKEEYKIDPISPVIEFFSSLKKGEQGWIQIVITPSKKAYHTKGTYFGTHDWVKEAENIIDKILKPYTAYKSQANAPKGTSFAMESRTPDKLKPIVEGISNKVTKIGFDTGIRICYVAKKEAWNMNNRRNIRLVFRQYANPNLNQLMRFNSTQADAYGGIFSIGPKKVTRLANRMLTEYRERSFFHSALRQKLFGHIPWPISPAIFPNYFQNEIFVLNVEELATLWHFPGQILKVPTLERIESKEAAPPTNLPI